MTKPLSIDGVDISHWQSGNLDFDAAKCAGVQWVYHKATEGTHYKDPRYDDRRKEVKAAGLPFGAYHFARPQKGDAVAEARWFVGYAKPEAGDLRPVLDLETLDDLSGMPLVRWADEFCAEVERLTGVVPICYTPYELSTELEETSLMWRPRYNDRNEPPRLPYDIWQFSNGRYGVPNEVAGLGHVDLNYMRPGLRLTDLLIGRETENEHEDGTRGPNIDNALAALQRAKPSKRNREHVDEAIDHLKGIVPWGGEPEPEPKPKRIGVVAREVIDGKWGNGPARRKRLKAAGHNPAKVQRRVNRLLQDAVTPEPEPEPAPEPKSKGKPARLRFAHASLQFSDGRKQQQADVDTIFARGYDIITGTEAGQKNGNSRALKAAARKHGYRLHNPSRYDTWVAVKKTLVVGKWRKGAEFALWRSSRTPGDQPGRWGDKAVAWVSWDMGATYGEFAVGAVHNLTWGGAGPKHKQESDRTYADVMGEWAADKGKATALAFIGGDFNRKDSKNDLFFGEPLTTCWDDLKKWPNTGHGNIDAIARYDKDGRVKCVGARALNDKRLSLHTDHYLVEAEYEIQPL